MWASSQQVGSLREQVASTSTCQVQAQSIIHTEPNLSWKVEQIIGPLRLPHFLACPPDQLGRQSYRQKICQLSFRLQPKSHNLTDQGTAKNHKT
jgi:hypothetical protein